MPPKNQSETPLVGPAAKEMLKRPTSTIFKPAIAPATVSTQSLNKIIQEIKPPTFPNLGKGIIPEAFNSSYKPTIPTFNLPDFKSLIPPIKFDK